MRIISETDLLSLTHLYEIVYLTHKSTGETLLEEAFYGDPSCGLIGEDDDWAIIAGTHVMIWTPHKSKKIEHAELKDVHALRVKNPQTVELLVDPWSETASIWEIDVVTFEYRKIRDFPEYRDREYAGDVVW